MVINVHNKFPFCSRHRYGIAILSRFLLFFSKSSKICAIRAICATKNSFRVRTHFTDPFPLFIR